MAFLIGGANTLSAAGFNVDNSCRYNFGDSPKLSKSVSSGSGSTKFTFSVWFKTTTVNSSYGRLLWNGDSGGSYETNISLYADGRLAIYWNNGSDGARSWLTNAKYLDPSAWYHMVVRYDSTDGTAGDRVQLWINGTRVTAFSESTNPGSSEVINVFKADVLSIGREVTSADRFSFDGYFAEVCVIDNTAYTATDFGEFDSDSPTIWKPKDVSGLTFGTNGFYLDFKASGNLGNDANGGTDLDESNIVAADQATDTPTNNFATLNPLDAATSSGITFSEGNTLAVGAAAWRGGSGTFGASSGKWYWEVAAAGDYKYYGIATAGFIASGSANYEGGGLGGNATTEHVYAYGNDGKQYTNNTSGAQTNTSYGDSYTTELVGVAFNLDDNELTFYKDNAVQNSGTAISIASGFTYLPFFSFHNVSSGTFNFGGSSGFAISSGNADANGYGNFEHAPPSGYFALCTKNLAEYG